MEKQIDAYHKLKPVYDRYKASKDKEKFRRGFESKIILFKAVAREIKRAEFTKLPSTKKLQTELRKMQQEEKLYDALRYNVDTLLERLKEQEKIEQIELI